MSTPPMTKLPQLDTMDQVRFHTHFADVTSLGGIRRRKKGDLESGCSTFIKTEKWTDPEKVALRESAIQVPKTQRTSKQRELTPAPCPGILMDNEVTVDDLQWCHREMKS